MDSEDVHIGERLQALRGPVISQAALANAMKERGHEKWSQATVWAVEAGKRPLRLSEAASLASILQADVNEFLLRSETADTLGALRDAIFDVNRAASELRSAAASLEDARTCLSLTIRGINLDGIGAWHDSDKERLAALLVEADECLTWRLDDLAVLDDQTGEALRLLERRLGTDDGVDQ